MVKHRFHIPGLKNMLDELVGSQWFVKRDFRSGYHQIMIFIFFMNKQQYINNKRHNKEAPQSI